MTLYLWRYIIPDALHYTEVEPYLVCDKALDDYNSLVWCERYQSAGNFRLTMRASEEMLRYFTENFVFVTRPDTDRAMFFERAELESSVKGGSALKISGKSAEGLASLRIIQQKAGIENMNAAEAIAHYMRENIGSHWYYNTDSNHEHGINNPYSRLYINILQHGIDDARITTTLSAEPFSMNLMDFITQTCKAGNFGFNTIFSDKKFLYSCYKGYDRSLNQTERNPVVFSNDFDNLGNTEYIYDKTTRYTHVIAGGSGNGVDRVTADRFTGFRLSVGAGLNLREKFVNASGVSDSLVGSAAFNVLASSDVTQSFDGEVLSGGQFKYRQHYNLGDTVTVQNPYGVSGSAIVSEVVETVDAAGYKVIPAFTEWRGENA